MTPLIALDPVHPRIHMPQRPHQGPAWPEGRVRRRIRDALAELFGDRLNRAVLFGSRARGDADPDSDYDLAVFLAGYASSAADRRLLTDLRQALLLETGEFVAFVAFAPTRYNDAGSLLMLNIRREGREL